MFEISFEIKFFQKQCTYIFTCHQKGTPNKLTGQNQLEVRKHELGRKFPQRLDYGYELSVEIVSPEPSPRWVEEPSLHS